MLHKASRGALTTTLVLAITVIAVAYALAMEQVTAPETAVPMDTTPLPPGSALRLDDPGIGCDEEGCWITVQGVYSKEYRF